MNLLERLCTPSNRFEQMDRHFSPVSELYAGGDQLMTALRRGWQMDMLVFRADHPLGTTRHVSIFSFVLRRDSEKMTLGVVANPYITRLVNELGVHVVHLQVAQARMPRVRTRQPVAKAQFSHTAKAQP